MLKVFAVRDVKADSYGSPICCPTLGLALRSFIEACADARSPMHNYPEDFQLYELGSYDPSSGRLEALAVPSYVASAAEALSRKPVVAEEANA